MNEELKMRRQLRWLFLSSCAFYWLYHSALLEAEFIQQQHLTGSIL